MTTVERIVTAVAGILLIASIVCAQDPNTAGSGRSAITVTAAATADRVRFTAPSSVVQTRLEVYNANGERVFDNEIRGGNVIEWLLKDGQAQRLSDGSYLCVVTSKSLSARINQKTGMLTILNAVATVEPIDSTRLSAQQTQAVGPLEENSSLTVVSEDENQTATVIAHNGTEGQIVRGRGALSFRLGDFFGGKDVEQMRLTPEGNLGIGITNPTVRLDVDGLIRASEGIVFPDGSIQYSASRKTYGEESLLPGQSQKKHGDGEDLRTAATDTSGTGTTGKIPKWLDGPAGVLTDSNFFDVSGALGVNGTPDTRFRMDVNGSTRIRGSNPGFNLEGLRSAGNIWLFQTVDDDGRFRLFGQDNVNPGVERLTISLSSGNIGIGATAPTAKLDVAGAINTSTQYNIGGNRVLGIDGFDNVFAGAQAGASNTEGARNAFFGSTAGHSNMDGFSNSFFGESAGGANVSGYFNAFFGGNAGEHNTAFGNSFFGALAGISNTTGAANAIFGYSAGSSNTMGASNSFVGSLAGSATTTGGLNSFFGYNAGVSNVLGSNNTIIGSGADLLSSPVLTNASAIGANATVHQSNTLVLGSINGLNNATADTKVGIGTPSPNERLTVKTATSNFGVVHTDGTVTVGSYVGGSTGGGWYGTKSNHSLSLFVNNGAPSMTIATDGNVSIAHLTGAANSTLCTNTSKQIVNCTSSLRYKTDVHRFLGGLDIVNRLRPISFTWKEGGIRDIGLAAEEVDRVSPLLAFRNDRGEVEGVRYNELSAVFINTFKEQQAQIQQQQEQLKHQREQAMRQQEQIKQQQEALGSLQRLVCRSHPSAKACKK